MKNGWIMNYYFFPSKFLLFFHVIIVKYPTIYDMTHNMIWFILLNDLQYDFNFQKNLWNSHLFQFSFALCRCFLEDCFVVMVLSFFQTPVCSSWLGAGGCQNKSASSTHSLALVCLISHKSKTTCPNLFELTSTKSLDEL